MSVTYDKYLIRAVRYALSHVGTKDAKVIASGYVPVHGKSLPLRLDISPDFGLVEFGNELSFNGYNYRAIEGALYLCNELDTPYYMCGKEPTKSVEITADTVVDCSDKSSTTEFIPVTEGYLGRS